MKQWKIWVGLGFYFCTVLKHSLAIDCYHCASLDGKHKECEDRFRTDISTEHLISRNCMSGYWKAKFCIKLDGVKEDGTTILIRQCATRDWGSHCGLIQFDLGNRIEDIDGCLETCNFDGCNLATITKANTCTTVCLSVILLVLFWKWYR